MLYEAEATNRPRANGNKLTGLQGDLQSLTSPGTVAGPPVDINYTLNDPVTHGNHYSRSQLDMHTKPSNPYSDQYPNGAVDFSPLSPVYAEPHSQYVYPQIRNNVTTFPAEGITSGSQEYPAINLFPRRNNHYTSGYTPSSAFMSHPWPSTVEETPISDPVKKKSRRERPKIALAPDQPPTTQGKPRARVYVACIQCRNRKIRCDGVKPICYNCGRKSNGGHECNYDAAPRRRGPDKLPGARQRVAKEVRQELESNGTHRRRKRRETTPSKFSENLSQTIDRDSAVADHSMSNSLSPESSSSHSMSPSYTTTSTSFPSPPIKSPLYGGCPCHGLIYCPSSQPYVSSRTQLLPFFDQRPAPGHLEVEQLSNTVNLTGAKSRECVSSADDYIDEFDDVTEISNEPSLIFSRKIWYEALCSIYASFDTRRLTYTNREAISRSISRDLRFLFRTSNYWFSFFHIPSFFGQFFDPIKRENMQPSLVLAALALSTFWQSSEIEGGEKGRTRALRLREEAQSALEASFNVRCIDETLAQAAWLLALFEVCAHPEHSTARSVSAVIMLDSIIRCLALTVLDADDPNTYVSAAGQVSRINTSFRCHSVDRPSLLIPHHEPCTSVSSGCDCLSRTLGKYWPKALEYAPMWATTPAWNPSWSEAEIRKESSRRLCWASISLAAGHVSYASANDSHIPDLYIADPSNFALLYSGESICRALYLLPSAAKDTVWALYDRSFVLWHICARIRADTSMGDAEKGDFAIKAWLEADVIENALNKHTCGIEKAYIFQGREYLFNTRMCISFDFQRHIPLVNTGFNGIFHRTKAKEWLTHQGVVAERFMLGLHTITGNSNNSLARRPFFVFWFMSQVLRSLRLWQCDNSLTIALDVCKAFLPAIDYLSAIWPCDVQRQRYMLLRARLDSACNIAGISPPPPVNLALPDPSTSVSKTFN